MGECWDCHLFQTFLCWHFNFCHCRDELGKLQDRFGQMSAIVTTLTCIFSLWLALNVFSRFPFDFILPVKDVQDPSVIVSFPLDEDASISLVAWTTTPWTLPSNLALCVNPELQYVKLRGKCQIKIVYNEPTFLQCLWIHAFILYDRLFYVKLSALLGLDQCYCKEWDMFPMWLMVSSCCALFIFCCIHSEGCSLINIDSWSNEQEQMLYLTS